MNMPTFSVKRPVTTLMIFLLIMVLGVVSLFRLKVDLMPEMTFPVASVITTYEGVGPQEIENLVTRPLEGVLGTVANIERITTYSTAGQSIVIMEFNWGTDMDFALLDVREKIDLIKGYFPDGVESPLVFKFDSAMMPIINLAVTGEADLVTLKKMADEEVKPALERLSGVASVDVSGGLVPVIKIEADPVKLHAYGLTLQNITQFLQAENLNLPGGTVQSGNLELIVRTTGEFKRIEQIEDLNLVSPSGGLVKLKEVARVFPTYKELNSYVLLNGQPAVGISIQKETDANTVETAKRVVRELEKLKRELPSTVKLDVVMNQADFIQHAIRELRNSALLGGFLAVAILFLFLRNFPSTLIIGLSIPISIITTFVLMYFAKLELNMMTLGGLALGVGMMVDNAIVVLENIFRFRDEGYELEKAAVEGSTEVGMAITASTLTTVVVFLPVVFMEGMTSQFFKELALTVTISLLASLFVAQTLVPMLSSKFLYVRGKKARQPAAAKTQAFPEKRDRLGWYKKSLAWALQHRKTVIFLSLFLFLFSFVMVFRLGAEFIPQMDQGMISIQIRMPKGTVLRETEEVVARVEAVLFALPEVKMVASTVGGGGSTGSFGISTAGTDRASLTILLVDKDKRARSSEEVAEAIRAQIGAIPGAVIQVQASTMSFSGGKPVNIKLKGRDFAQLEAIAADLVNLIKEVEGTREVESSLDEGRPELQVRIDRERASALGLNAYTVASYLRTAIAGATATTYKVNGEEYDVVVSLEKNEKGIPGLGQLLIPTPFGSQVPLSEVAELQVVEGPVTITREDQERVVSISAALIGRDLNSAVVEINRKLAGYPLPSGYTLSFGGEAEEMQKAFRDLLLALLLAVIFVYMIMAAQFESLLQPLIIMFTVPLGFIGVVWGLAIGKFPVSVPAMVGLIMLAGIVVNNGIVLVDYTNILKKKGYQAEEALLLAGPVRFRPIMMTALTTILGLIPMAIGSGDGAELQAPMAVAVIGGLVVATALTLIVVPVFYLSFDLIGHKRRARKAQKLQAGYEV